MNRRFIYYLCIVIGLFVVFYAHKLMPNSEFLSIIGVVLLMLGLYKISSGLVSKTEDSSFIKTEYDEEE